MLHFADSITDHFLSQCFAESRIPRVTDLS